ncbi:MAG: Gfo/Idh/MocA family oxidoreductase [Telmatospirillum sp.]|nr:Gfo/Idh/MocA family oxidoreductase [Telmatospirillum sp.]
MTGRRLRIGVVGLGMASKPHVAALKDLQGARLEVVGVFARDRERREAFARAHGWPAAASVEAMAADPALDAVLILTPPNARAEFIDMFARAGKAILMEKPIERTTAAAEAIVEATERAKVPLGIVFQHRLRPGATALRAKLQKGELGAISQVRLDVPWWRAQSYYDEPGRGTYARDGGGVLISQAIHAMDLMLSLTAPVRDVVALAGTTRLHRMESEDFAAAGLRFADGAMGAVTATTSAYPGGTETLAIHAEHGSATLRGGALTIAWRDGREEIFGEPVATGGGADPMAFDHGPHRAVLLDFLDAVAAGRAPTIDGRSALRVHRLIDAILESARTGARATVATERS